MSTEPGGTANGLCSDSTVVSTVEELLPEDITAEPTNTVALDLQAGGVSFTLRTQTALSFQVVELASKLELTTNLLRETQRRLEATLLRIGYLEAQLSHRDAVQNPYSDSHNDSQVRAEARLLPESTESL